MKINKIDHICIAVKNLAAAREIWEPLLGKSKPDDEYIDEPEKIKVARYWVGEAGFELMESTTPDGDVAKFIEKRGGHAHQLQRGQYPCGHGGVKAKGLPVYRRGTTLPRL